MKQITFRNKQGRRPGEICNGFTKSHKKKTIELIAAELEPKFRFQLCYNEFNIFFRNLNSIWIKTVTISLVFFRRLREPVANHTSKLTLLFPKCDLPHSLTTRH